MATEADGPKLLIAEDDPDIANALVTYAKRFGFRPFHAPNGLVALDIGLRERPAAILLDIALPGLDGRDVMVRLKEAGVLRDAVVVFATARDSQLDRLTGLELGAADYETKPFHFDTLFHKLKNLLDKKRRGEI